MLLAACQAPADPWAPFLGQWEYRQRNSGRPEGVDAEGERLEIVRRGDAIAGVYFGLEREGEHGLFYTVTEVSGLSLDERGTLAFTVPPRTLFNRRPADLDDARSAGEAHAGVTRDTLRLTGRIEDGELVLYCAADRPSCPDRQMVFRASPGATASP